MKQPVIWTFAVYTFLSVGQFAAADETYLPSDSSKPNRCAEVFPTQAAKKFGPQIDISQAVGSDATFVFDPERQSLARNRSNEQFYIQVPPDTISVTALSMMQNKEIVVVQGRSSMNLYAVMPIIESRFGGLISTTVGYKLELIKEFNPYKTSDVVSGLATKFRLDHAFGLRNDLPLMATQGSNGEIDFFTVLEPLKIKTLGYEIGGTRNDPKTTGRLLSIKSGPVFGNYQVVGDTRAYETQILTVIAHYEHTVVIYGIDLLYDADEINSFMALKHAYSQQHIIPRVRSVLEPHSLRSDQQIVSVKFNLLRNRPMQKDLEVVAIYEDGTSNTAILMNSLLMEYFGENPKFGR